MKMGRRFGNFVGWPAGPGALPQTVEVRIVNGKFIPCHACHWYSVCLVPKGKHMATVRQAAIRNYYQCADYIARTAQGYQEWYRPFYEPAKQCKSFNPNRAPQ